MYICYVQIVCHFREETWVFEGASILEEGWGAPGPISSTLSITFISHTAR